MAQGGNRYRVIGDYVVGQQIGSGSFAVVWRSRHRHHGYEVAIKEIATEKLSKKLRASLFLEIEILRQINHPNIIRLHEIVEAPGRIYLVLEYCTGGDLAAYIQRYGRVSEVIGRHFMSQLAAGLQVLREKNLIHRDLKPQNLLLSTNDRNAVLKIADFGFARSLQPQGLAETLCGSPLYMAPEIMQNQKYDAKADLWSVGVILFQLVTGSPPFSGNSQYQLLENIMRSNDLHFPPDVIGDLHPDCIDLCRRLLRRNPVERLSFEEFFNHKFMVQARPVGGPHNTSAGSGGNPFTHFQNASLESGGSPVSKTAKGSQDDCLPFGLDDDQHAHVASSSFSSKKNLFSDSFSSGFPDNNVLVSQNFSMKDSPIANEVQSDKPEADTNLPYTSSRYKLRRSFDSRPEEVSLLEGFQAADVEQELVNTTPSKGVADSLECIEQEYVLVNAHAASTETLSFSLGASGLDQPPGKLVSSPTERIQKSTSAPVQIVGTAVGSLCGVESLGSHGSIPSGTSQASVDLGDVLDRPSVHPPTRLLSLQKYAYSITELAMEKLVAGHQLEAFSIQLVCLAIWKKALYVSHSWAAASTEGNSSQEVLVNTRVMPAEADYQGAAAACSQMEQEFLIAVEHAENLSSYLGPLDGNAEMPDAMEIIFQRALALGIKGLVDQFIGQLDNAATSYSKSTTLLSFILVEATCLDLNPPFQLSPPDRQRLRRYIDSLTTHQNQSIADRMALVQPQSQRSL